MLVFFIRNHFKNWTKYNIYLRELHHVIMCLPVNACRNHLDKKSHTRTAAEDDIQRPIFHKNQQESTWKVPERPPNDTSEMLFVYLVADLF